MGVSGKAQEQEFIEPLQYKLDKHMLIHYFLCPQMSYTPDRKSYHINWRSASP